MQPFALFPKPRLPFALALNSPSHAACVLPCSGNEGGDVDGLSASGSQPCSGSSSFRQRHPFLAAGAGGRELLTRSGLTSSV